MLNRGVFHDINGCISTGKEVNYNFATCLFLSFTKNVAAKTSVPTVLQANVYHATKADGQELAIKVYKTSVLVFKYAMWPFSFLF